MSEVWRRFVGLGLLLAALGRPGSSSPHSYRYFYTSLSQPGQGLPQFSIVGYVNDHLIVKYDSDTRKMLPQAPWVEKAGKEDLQYWEGQTQVARNVESGFRVNLEILRGRYNQSGGGLHALQLMYGCEMRLDGGLPQGSYQYAYDGEDFLALDKETVTWTARVPQALPTKSRWEKELHNAVYRKGYLEETCTEWLKRYLNYGQETLLRTERPVTRVVHKKGYDDRETLYCQLYGFYPKEIEVSWIKDGVDQKPETLTGGVVPNSDGTYHTWLSIDVDSKEKDRYWCRVGHDSLLEPLDLAWEKPASSSNIGLIVGVVVGILGAILLAVGVAFYISRRRQPEGYRATAGSEQGSENSTKVPIA